MKVLHVISSLEIGGAQRLLSDLLPLLAEENEVDLLVNNVVENDFSKSIEKGCVRIISMDLQNLYSFRNFIALGNAMKGYDIVHVHLFPTLYWAAFASLFVDVKLVCTEHSTSNKRRVKWYLKPIEKFVYGRYTKIISISDQTQKNLMTWLKAKQDDSRFVVVNNGVSLHRFHFRQIEPLYPYTLIMVSRFVESKDQKTLIRALSILPEEVHAIFVGDGPLLEDCKLEASRLGVESRAHFVGAQSDIISWLRIANVGVQSSNWEGFGLSVVEMMAAGLPIVASDVEGLKQVIDGAGLLFSKGNEKELADKIKCIMTDDNFREKLELASFERAKSFDISSTYKGYLKIYNSIIFGN